MALGKPNNLSEEGSRYRRKDSRFNSLHEKQQNPLARWRKDLKEKGREIIFKEIKILV